MVARSKICAQPKRLLEFFNDADGRQRHTVDAKATCSALGIVFVLDLNPVMASHQVTPQALILKLHLGGGKAESRIDGRPTTAQPRKPAASRGSPRILRDLFDANAESGAMPTPPEQM
ncbi:hypothetical protein CPAR01_15256 [Colletotrichum paranaense]|uniref:Uncharacterized protein n=1 Tax=Colletotrichum paranaense TaxID=1914294 RepID=A0ABQ9RZV3_9PEZI|nr:uncharacterized protein CPAR01_15256 [Colletotrichum paranaense]KAK1520205.1 hypothetical protein CPAR01_15256 [Colletotrichum paranaense]